MNIAAKVSTAYGNGCILDIRKRKSYYNEEEAKAKEEDRVFVVALAFGDLYACEDALSLIDFYKDVENDDDNTENDDEIFNTLLTSARKRRPGEVVHFPPYGDGKVTDYRPEDRVYRIKLSFGTLYVSEESLIRKNSVLSTNTMELNVAYEALEKMRMLNLELHCQEIGVKYDPIRCTRCLTSIPTTEGRNRRHSQHRPKKGTPCFICASPTCKAHSCPKFRREGNTVCLDCKHLFSLDYALDVITAEDPAQRSALLTRMFDTYDRTLLMLKYSSQFMEDIARELDENKSLKNYVGIGSSSAGLVSGSLGIAATACMFTPAAAVVAPLIIASIFFGGTSSTMQTGVEMATNKSEPNQLATRIIALYGMVQSIIRTGRLLGDVGLRCRQHKVMHLENFQVNHRTAGMAVESTSATSAAVPVKTDVVVVGASTNEAAGKNVRFITRSGASGVSMGSNAVSAGGGALSATAMTAASFASFAGGALSAAVLVCEAANMSNTIRDMRGGSRCPKAELLRKIVADLELLPETSELERECNVYTDHRPRPLSMEEASRMLTDLLGPEDPVLASFLKEKKKKEGKKNNKKNNEEKSERTSITHTDSFAEIYLCDDGINEESGGSSNSETGEGECIATSAFRSSSSEAIKDDDDENKNEKNHLLPPERVVAKKPINRSKSSSSRRSFWRGWSSFSEEAEKR